MAVQILPALLALAALAPAAALNATSSGAFTFLTIGDWGGAKVSRTSILARTGH